MLWKCGESGNPTGWSSAQRRLYKGFLTDVQKRWREHGGKCLDAMIRDDPAGFVKMCAALMPKSLEATLTTRQTAPEMSLPDAIRELTKLADSLGLELKQKPLPHNMRYWTGK